MSIQLLLINSNCIFIKPVAPYAYPDCNKFANSPEYLFCPLLSMPKYFVRCGVPEIVRCCLPLSCIAHSDDTIKKAVGFLQLRLVSLLLPLGS